MLVVMIFLMIITEIPDFNGIAVADWILPTFLFIAGMSIPYAIGKRAEKGDDLYLILRHIIIRSVSLLVIGVLMFNISRVNPELTGLNKDIWAVLMFISVFLLWNNYKYSDDEESFFKISALRFLGMAAMVILVFKFQSGHIENNGSLIIGDWGVLGKIGWGYLVAALIYLIARDNVIATAVSALFFLILSIISAQLFNLFETIVPFVVLSGVLTTVLMKKFSKNIITIIVAFGAVNIVAGYFLITIKTPVYIGISLLLFAFIFWIIEVKKHTSWTLPLKPIGENSLTAFLASALLYHLMLLTGLSHIPFIFIAWAILWAFVMVGITKLNIRLRL